MTDATTIDHLDAIDEKRLARLCHGYLRHDGDDR
jgi:hypothetical protein